jgi:Zn-dependent protease
MRGGSFKLFQVAGIKVYLHFTWFLVAWYQINSGLYRFHQPVWAAIEYVGLFVIVLLHEFGHAFACRSTGGRADRIILWPLGGLAFVNPPLRPSAVLWSIFAGPLVNVVLFPVLLGFAWMTGRYGFVHISADAHRVLVDLWAINLFLLVFNLLPFYPLDGGQIVRALLWFKIGASRSLRAAAVIGIVGAALLGLFAILQSSIWIGLLAFFIFSQAGAAFQHANNMELEADLAARAAATAAPPPITPQNPRSP